MNDRLGSMLGILSGTAFGTLAIFGKLGVIHGGLNLWSLLAWRFLSTSFLLTAWVLLKRENSHSKKDLMLAFSMGVIGYAVQTYFYFESVLRVGAGTAALLLYAYPSLVTLLAWGISKEKPTSRRFSALALSLLGCVLCGDLLAARIDVSGVLFGLGSALWYAVYLTYGGGLVRRLSPSASTAGVSLGAGLSFLLIALANDDLRFPGTPSALAAVIGIVLVATILPVVTLFESMRRIGPARASLLSTTEAASAVFLGWLVFGETLTASQLAGGALILLAVLWGR